MAAIPIRITGTESYAQSVDIPIVDHLWRAINNHNERDLVDVVARIDKSYRFG